MSNYEVIASWLMDHGFSRAAAAGIVGTIAGESGGNPESVGSGGGGLIGWTPISSAYPHKPIVTGHPKKDLDMQLIDLVAYVKRNGSISDMNKFKDPVQAARHFSAKYERPAVTYSDVRESVARDMYAFLAHHKQGQGASGGGGGGGSGGGAPALGLTGGLSTSPIPIPGFEWLGNMFSNLGGVGKTVGDIGTAVAAVGHDFEVVMTFITRLFEPALWLRVGAFLAGILLLGAGAFFVAKAMGFNPHPLQKAQQAGGMAAMAAA